jgi:hypothetical protein
LLLSNSTLYRYATVTENEYLVPNAVSGVSAQRAMAKRERAPTDLEAEAAQEAAR